MPKQVEDGGRRSAVAGGARRPPEVGGLGKGGLGEGVVGGGWWPAEHSGRRSAVAAEGGTVGALGEGGVGLSMGPQKLRYPILPDT